MTKPVYKIEIYDSIPDLIHTIEKDAINIRTTEVLTNNVGTFSFAVPTKKNGSDYYFDDVCVEDMVKFWFGYDSVSGDPDFVGKILRITAPLSTETGYIRVFKGRSQGEILQRRFKTNKRWIATDASVIVTELGNELGLITKIGTADSGDTHHTVDAERTEAEDYWNGQYIHFITGPNKGFNELITDFHAGTDTIDHTAFPNAVAAGHEYVIWPTEKIKEDTTDVTLTVKTDTYFDLLRKISDYWYDAGKQVKKDFYVDVDNNLVWKARPFRSSGVETLTVGENIVNYQVLRDIERVRNNIQVYGAANTFIPTDQDYWTENHSANWTAVQGTLQHDYSNGWAKVGTYCIKSTAPVSEICQFYRTHAQVTIRTVNSINFWHLDEAQASVNNYVRLRAPDVSNYFQADLSTGTNWMFESITLGPENEYSATLNPNGKWSKTASPNWWDIQAIEFYYVRNAENQSSRTDGVYYAPDRVYGSAEDATYEQRDLEIIDDTLLTAADCSVRAESLLWQLKAPATRIDLTTLGNTNVKVGDRLVQSIPAEGISSQNFDVVSVTHSFSPRGFITMAVMVDSGDVRTLPPTSLTEVFRVLKNTQGMIGKGIRLVR